MTDRERIESILDEMEYGYIGYENLYNNDAQGMNLIEKALKQYLADRWIPVEERLPEEEGWYLISEERGIGAAYHCKKFKWTNVIAWKPTPEPYVPDIDVGEKESKK